jgi:N-methylhydantoinase B/oxoprolinase/acetone carboxylase alpha subunit
LGVEGRRFESSRPDQFYQLNLEAGGGGFGDPRMRVLAALTEDARNGFVSPDSARRNYGAEIDPETGEARRP